MHGHLVIVKAEQKKEGTKEDELEKPRGKYKRVRLCDFVLWKVQKPR